MLDVCSPLKSFRIVENIYNDTNYIKTELSGLNPKVFPNLTTKYEIILAHHV